MSDNPCLALIEGLNSEDATADDASASPIDYAAELSLWTNAEFTFDIPPGLGIFESDSGFDQLAASNTLLLSDSSSIATPTATTTTVNSSHGQLSPVLGQHIYGEEQQQQQQQQHAINTPNDSRPLSLLERTRQRNPLNEESRPELQEQVAAVNSFHSLLAAYSAATSQTRQVHQQVRLQQHQHSSYPAIQPVTAPALTAAPTTPAAAKLLRQSIPQYTEPAPIAKKPRTLPTAIVPSLTAPSLTSSQSSSPKNSSVDQTAVSSSSSSAVNETDSSQGNDAEEQEQPQLSAADSFSKDDPEYQTKVLAEEDKRRRNTAASARFRQKKKLREQTLEQTAREQTARAEALELKVRELEMEVRWLRGLIVEKDSRLYEATVNLQDANKRIRLESL
ncbi:hypothetical protein BC939DRAFT_268987 [Gamsiella multidivaricata]|uniref:uncharacterized protein n=1 Tax=Gamsiella multidivaricata TaxID=101098 RepID=UPI002220290B|nr:uncharacterized protein BC939DRAFT_268987 [Gamsiella multidivaricata]KAG0369577.1 hypothetical protein BGZ54_009553 [Gamsiella multidivaricata]KAI7819265.1 hypothetical protein BC939DRAFT_268987 [Gamsiella multidivaricata]